MSMHQSRVKTSFLKKASGGFTLVEILVAGGILVVISAAIATSMLQLKKDQVKFQDKSEAMLFLNGLATSLMSNQTFCTDVVRNQGLPIATDPEAAFRVINYTGYGAVTGPIQDGTVISGTAANPRLRVKEMRVRAKAGLPISNVRINGINLSRQVAEVSMLMEVKGQDDFEEMQDWNLDLPVYVDALGRMQACQLYMQQSDVCQMMGSVVDPGTGNCIPQVQCQVNGSYVTSVCSPAYGGCSGGVPNPALSPPGLGCPSESVASRVGEFSQTFTVSCGKKCAYPVVNTLNFYLCMRCM